MWLVKRDRDQWGLQPSLNELWHWDWPWFSRLWEEDSVVWSPRVDVSENDNEIVVKADLPGVDKKDLKVQLENNTLTIAGERKYEKEDKSDRYYHSERAYGRFQRSFTLSDHIKADEIKAEYKNGVLTVTLPKSEEVKPKQIEIK